MFKYIVECDMCERPIPTHIDEDGFEHVLLARTKEWNTKHLFPHLCEDCASKIDSTLIKFKDSVTRERELMVKYKAINDERRERLGTKG